TLIPSNFGKVNEKQRVTVRAASGSFRLATVEYNGTTGNGTWAGGSPVVSNVTTSKGEFKVGQPVFGPFPSGTTIVSVSPGQIVGSKPANFTCSFAAFCQVSSNSLHEPPDLPANATAAEVEAALDALPEIGGKGGTVSVTGGPGDASGSNPYVIA